MIFSTLNAFVDLLWALLVVILITFVFSIIFCNSVAFHLNGLDLDKVDNESLDIVKLANKQFGGVYTAMISLWSAVSGGNDWMYYGELLQEIDGGDAYFLLFVFYVAFCIVGLFNVVTGVFVDSAVCSRTEDEVVQGYIDEMKNTTSEIKRFFNDADLDRSGTLSFKEFQTHLRDPLVKAYFSGLDIDPSEASIIFTILDADKSNELLIDEFVNGIMKLKGSATKLDVMAMMFDHAKQNMKFDRLCEFVETELYEIRSCLNKYAPAAPRIIS